MENSSLSELVQTIGYIGLFAMIFAESGLFFGFFLPGDSVLFTAGFLASQGIFNITILVPLVVIAAITGDQTGYWMGGWIGRKLMNRKKENFFFSKHNLEKANKFYEAHGGKALILARFVPAVRTFVPIVAGMARMKYSTFISYNAIGGIIWGMGLTLLGYFLGNSIPGVDKYLLPIVGLIIIVSAAPALFHMRGEIKTLAKKNKLFGKIMKLKEAWLG